MKWSDFSQKETLEKMELSNKIADIKEKITQLASKTKNLRLENRQLVEENSKLRTKLQRNAEENAFFAEVWQSQKDFAEIAVPFWAGAQTSNANLGKAFADSLK